MYYKIDNYYEFDNLSQPYSFLLGEIIIKLSFSGEPGYLSFSDSNDIYISVMTIKGEVLSKEVFSYTETITFGSSHNNTIFVDNSTVSKRHCQIKYNHKRFKWMILDGWNKPSTNGIWMILNKGINISLKKDESNQFKFGNQMFSIIKCKQ